MVKVTLALFAALLLQDKVENPQYKSWSACKPGSFVKSKMEMSMSGMDGTAETTTSLKAIDEKEATIETKQRVTFQGQTMEQPAQEQKIEAKIDAEKAPKITKEGEEEIEVGGKKLKCRWIEVAVEEQGKKGTSKVWISEEIPGGMAKSETTFEGGGSIKMTTTSWEKK